VKRRQVFYKANVFDDSETEEEIVKVEMDKYTVTSYRKSYAWPDKKRYFLHMHLKCNTDRKGNVIAAKTPSWAIREVRLGKGERHEYSKTKLAAYRKELAALRKNRKIEYCKWFETIESYEKAERILKSLITRFSRKTTK